MAIKKQETMQEILETRRQIEEIVGSTVGTVKTDLKLTDDEYEKLYVEMCEKSKQTFEKLKKYRPYSLALGLAITLLGIILLLCSIFMKDGEILGVGIFLLFLGGGVVFGFSPKLNRGLIEKIPSKEKYFDQLINSKARLWLEEAKKNNYYLDIQEQALTEKIKQQYGKVIDFKCPRLCLLVGRTEFTALSRKNSPVIYYDSFQIEKIRGITIQTRVHEESKSVHTEDKSYNNAIKRGGYDDAISKRYITTTEVTRSTEYLVSFSLSGRINPYSIYIGEDTNLLLSMVNLFEQLTGLAAQRI